jgi:hypothetical protein
MGAAPRAAAAAPSSPFFACLLSLFLFASVFSVSSQTLLLLRGVNGQFSHQARMARRLQQT